MNEERARKFEHRAVYYALYRPAPHRPSHCSVVEPPPPQRPRAHGPVHCAEVMRLAVPYRPAPQSEHVCALVPESAGKVCEMDNERDLKREIERERGRKREKSNPWSTLDHPWSTRLTLSRSAVVTALVTVLGVVLVLARVTALALVALPPRLVLAVLPVPAVCARRERARTAGRSARL